MEIQATEVTQIKRVTSLWAVAILAAVDLFGGNIFPTFEAVLGGEGLAKGSS